MRALGSDSEFSVNNFEPHKLGKSLERTRMFSPTRRKEKTKLRQKKSRIQYL